MINWEARREGVLFFKDGQHVVTLPYDMIPALLLTLAKALKHRPDW